MLHLILGQFISLLSGFHFLASPTLTLWVGLASGYVAAYMVHLVKSTAKRIELVPTRKCIKFGTNFF